MSYVTRNDIEMLADALTNVIEVLQDLDIHDADWYKLDEAKFNISDLISKE